MPISQIVTNSIANNAVTSAKLASDAFSAQIFKPSITAPANNATGILNNQLFTATSYLSLYGRSQANAQWEISTSPSFAFINVNSTITGSMTSGRFLINTSGGNGGEGHRGGQGGASGSIVMINLSTGVITINQATSGATSSTSAGGVGNSNKRTPA